MGDSEKKEEKKKLLVIDDDVAFRSLMVDWFSQMGYQVQSVATGDEGMRAAKETSPGVILLDVMMPNVSGIEVLRTLQSDTETASIPILVLTGSQFDFTLRELFKQESNCSGFLSKSAALDQISREVEAIFAKT